MNVETFAAKRRSVETPSGRISYVEHGEGPVALFVHGVLLNGYLWRHQLAGLADLRRCIAVDLLAHGHTAIDPRQDVSSTANAAMLAQFLDALRIDEVDLVGNDSGGGIALIFAANHPGARAQPCADGLRHARQLAAEGLRAVPRDGGRGWAPGIV